MTDKIVESHGIKIHYRIYKGKGQPLVFLHGGGGSLTAWEIILPRFKDTDFTLITVDLRGHGLSDRPKEMKNYTLENHAGDILHILEKEKLNKVVLIGHCFGGMVAATFAALYPSKIEKLILINTNFELSWYLGRTPLKQILYSILNTVKYLFRYKQTSYQRVDYSQFIGSFDIDLRRLKADLDVMGVYCAIRQALALLGWQGRGYFEKIIVPTLFIAGTHDLLYPKGTNEEVARLIKNVQFEYVESNHISIINNPAEVYDKIIKFLQTT